MSGHYQFRKCSSLSWNGFFDIKWSINYSKNKISDMEIENLKSILVDTCYQFRRSKIGTGILQRKHKEALKSLRQNRDIIISKPDKGMGTVLLDKTDYITKMYNILDDHSKFQKLSSMCDSTDKVEQQLTDMLKSLKNNNIITCSQFDNLKPTGSRILRLYGLPKVHKPGCLSVKF